MINDDSIEQKSNVSMGLLEEDSEIKELKEDFILNVLPLREL